MNIPNNTMKGTAVSANMNEFTDEKNNELNRNSLLLLNFYRPDKEKRIHVTIQAYPTSLIKSILPALACFYLSAGKFPVVLKLAIASLGGKILSFATNYCRYNFYPLHLIL